ncbi:probable BOI-related E3 ubiquitin-protein ligase 3 [Mercurialis annua]|uniref:probable BOI-related E3 ubiquitin-protein ligase 3 n=1 Tax=Mercurialis annua TaxID=3986 RepID=UPI00215E6B3F|nr:probable BOI-related E3 ubiquitin-protein ligase 3 [Mercurialis annua]
MAVEAQHLNLFPRQLLGNRELVNQLEGNTNIYSTQMGYRLPLSATTSTTETLLPMYNSVITDSIPQKNQIKSESGLSYNINVPMSRKRSRDSINPLISYPIPQPNNKISSPYSFLGQDISQQIHQQQIDVDHLISQHMEKVRMELEERRKRQARRIIEAIEEGMLKRLRAKEDEIEKMGKLNWALEEKVKSLCIENQIWRDLAQTNEATANALRTNLEQILTSHERTGYGVFDEAAAEMDDAQSCCGSSDEGQEREKIGSSEMCTLVGRAQDKETGGGSSNNSRMCRNCRKEESCVLLLPCRHLCLCTVCGSSLNTCPICKATKNASFHVNMS